MNRDPDTKAPGPRQVLIVDDHPIVCEGLRLLINHEPDLHVCGVEENFNSALEAVESLSPDIAIIDLNIKGGDGLQLIKAVKQMERDIPMLVLSMHDEGLYAERALRAGARGYLTKQEAGDRVLTALRSILNGEIYLTSALRGRLNRSKDLFQPIQDPVEDLSDRELQIFRLIGLGRGTRQISEELNVSIKTIESHRRNIKNKLGLDSATELVRQAVRWCEQEQSGEPVQPS